MIRAGCGNSLLLPLDPLFFGQIPLSSYLLHYVLSNPPNHWYVNLFAKTLAPLAAEATDLSARMTTRRRPHWVFNLIYDPAAAAAMEEEGAEGAVRDLES